MQSWLVVFPFGEFDVGGGGIAFECGVVFGIQFEFKIADIIAGSGFVAPGSFFEVYYALLIDVPVAAVAGGIVRAMFAEVRSVVIEANEADLVAILVSPCGAVEVFVFDFGWIFGYGGGL